MTLEMQDEDGNIIKFVPKTKNIWEGVCHAVGFSIVAIGMCSLYLFAIPGFYFLSQTKATINENFNREVIKKSVYFWLSLLGSITLLTFLIR